MVLHVKLKLLLFTAFFAFTSTIYSMIEINEQYAKETASKSLSIKDIISVKILTGGYSGAKLFKITTNQQAYAIRFFPERQTLEKTACDIKNIKIASEYGYGPKLFFVDPNNEFIIVEYLEKQTLESALQSGHMYEYLAELLRKIHDSPKTTTAFNVFSETQKYIDKIETEVKQIDDTKIKVLATNLNKKLLQLKKLLTPVMSNTTLCHNDLSPNNILFCNKQFIVFDNEFEGMNDAYFDIATIAISFCNNASRNDYDLLSAYIERKPTKKEFVKLQLTKQLVWLFYGSMILSRVNKDISSFYKIKAYTNKQLHELIFSSKVNSPDPQHRLKLAKNMILNAFAKTPTINFTNP